MPARTLLDITQDILAMMDGEEVNSITDTVESEQVARIVRDSYYYIVPNIQQKRHFDLFELDASGDSTKPVLMTVPSGIVDILWVKYDNRETAGANKEYEAVSYMSLPEFLDLTLTLNTDESNVSEMELTNSNGDFVFKYRTDHHPTIYTTFDDNQLIFDGYFSTLDTTLQADKTYCYGMVDPSTFTLSDTFLLDIDDDQYPLLIAEAKSQCFEELLKARNQGAERRSRRGWIKSQSKNSVTPNKTNFDLAPNYGRKV